jgi:hypothetical protein
MKDHNILDPEARHKINYSLPPLGNIFEEPTERKDMSPVPVSRRVITGLTVSKPFELQTAKRAKLESHDRSETPQEYEPLNKQIERNF